MEIELTEIPTNEADATAVLFVVGWINAEDGTISGDLYDIDNKRVAKKRVYSFTGPSKNIPFADLTTAQLAYMAGDDPDETWVAYLIGLWLDRRGIEYQEDATAAQLLTLVPVPDEGL